MPHIEIWNFVKITGPYCRVCLPADWLVWDESFAQWNAKRMQHGWSSCPKI